MPAVNLKSTVYPFEVSPNYWPAKDKKKCLFQRGGKKKKLVPDLPTNALPIAHNSALFSPSGTLQTSSAGSSQQPFSWFDSFSFFWCFALIQILIWGCTHSAKISDWKIQHSPGCIARRNLLPLHSFWFIYIMSMSCNYHNKDLVSSGDIARRPNSNSMAVKQDLK